MRWCRFLLPPTLLIGAAVAQVANRPIDEVDVTVHSGYTDVNLLFACRLRYLSHLPSSEGDTLRIRTVPQTECALSGDGLNPPTVPTFARGLLAGIDLDRPISTEVDIVVRWRRSERFLVMPTGDGRGLHIRVLRATESSGRVLVGGELGTMTASYAINLESSLEPYANEAVAAASKSTGLNVYVSETQIDDQHWYRLRAGPFATETDAKRTLAVLRATYPKAWLAIGDDATLNAPTGQVSPAPTPAPRPSTVAVGQDNAALLQQAKRAFRKKDYDTAIPLLTKLLEQPEFPERAEAQELIGLARERNRQLAHAKAEYEEYLRRYPDGPAADRVRQRLQALALAARKSVRGMSGAEQDESPWKIYGGFSQLYRRDQNELENSVTTSQATTQSVLLNDFALVARRRGERFDFSGRVSAGYAKNFLDNDLGDATRVGMAFVELADRQWEWRSRLGRQSNTGTGMLGLFDGVYVDYQWQPRWRFSVSAGSPVDSTRSSLNTDRQFTSLAVNYGPVANAWDFSLYTVLQQLNGETDRRAVGTEVHYFEPGRTLLALADYDFYFSELNNVLLLATVDLPARFTINVNADRRQTPLLSVRNALIGQDTSSFDELLTRFTREEIDQFARDRTAITELYSVSVSRPMGERWQWTLDASSIGVGGTRESGGVEALPEAPREHAYSALVIGNGVFTAGDLEVIALRYQTSSVAQTSSVGLSVRWPLWTAWRITPRIRVDRRVTLADDAEQTVYAPSLRIDYQWRRAWFELEAGSEFGERDVGTSFEKARRDFVSVGYRYNF